jgi:peptidoglycan-associated lipoprotein
MYNRLNPHTVVLMLLCLGAFAAMGGCSGKRVASSSGDAASTSKEKSAAAPAETISPDRMTTIPDDRRSTTEAAREPMAPSALTERESARSSAGPSGVGAPADGVMPSGLGDIFFDFDQYVIRKDAQPVMEANAAWIKSASGKSFLIEGHCDERGTQAYNLVLGEKRARSAKRYLEDLGVPASRLKITSFGEMRPFCKERDEHCYQQNRRAHFVAH